MRTIDLIRSTSPTISAGILSADVMHLSDELAALEGTGVRLIHFDIMDGRFVPMMTVGPAFVKGIRTSFLKDVHLMIEEPGANVGEYVRAGADLVTLHVESCSDMRPILRDLERMENVNDPGRGIVRGIALNPDTPLDTVLPLLDDIEMIVVLAVNPRVKGFPFLETIGERFELVKELATSSGREILLCLDGGIKRSNIGAMARLGADILVSGSAIFDGKAPAENARFMMHAAQSQID